MPNGMTQFRSRRNAADRLLWVAWMLIAPYGLCGCYFGQLAARQLALVNEQRPLPGAAASEPDGARRAMLDLVPDLRSFALNKVQLPVGRSYTGYYRTDAKGILFVVVGSDRLQLEAYTWWFPVVGSASYKAYTQESDARAEAERLERAGYDAYVGRVTAYSTLGFFRDPVTSIMMRHGTAAFVEILLHEMAHGRLYVPGHTDFNEQLASFVGRTAAEQYLRARCADNPTVLASFAIQKQQQETLDALISSSLAQLDALYASGKPAAAVLQQRALIFTALQSEFAKLYPDQDAADLVVNNARLLQYRRYVTGLDELERMWAQAGESWPLFWQLVERYVDTQL